MKDYEDDVSRKSNGYAPVSDVENDYFRLVGIQRVAKRQRMEREHD